MRHVDIIFRTVIHKSFKRSAASYWPTHRKHQIPVHQMTTAPLTAHFQKPISSAPYRWWKIYRLLCMESTPLSQPSSSRFPRTWKNSRKLPSGFSRSFNGFQGNHACFIHQATSFAVAVPSGSQRTPPRSLDRHKVFFQNKRGRSSTRPGCTELFSARRDR